MSSPRITDGLAAMKSAWTFGDLIDAIDVLDAFDGAERELHRKTQAEMEARRNR